MKYIILAVIFVATTTIIALTARNYEHNKYVAWCNDFSTTYHVPVQMTGGFFNYQCITEVDGVWMLAYARLDELSE